MHSAHDFINSVLALRPQLAAFDCDGTMWSGDSGEDFMRWTMEKRIVSSEVSEQMEKRYTDYKAGKVGEEEMCGEMVAMYAGIPVSTMENAAQGFFRERIPARVYPEMASLVAQLKNQNCELWLVSSTNDWVVREGARHLALNESHVLGAAAEIENGVVTSRLKRVPSGEGKARAIREVALPQYPAASLDAAFGNSIHDLEMLRLARSPFAINPTTQLEQIASAAGWPMYFTAPK